MTTKRTIGELIENEVRRQQVSIIEFANKIGCKRNNVYDIFNRSKMDIVQLKLISKVLNRNFFKELAEDVELINDNNESKEAIKKHSTVSQFFKVVPDVLYKLGKSSTIVFGKLDDPEYEDCPIPDFLLPDYFITFTIGETLKERIGNCTALPIYPVYKDDSCMVEVCTNIVHGSICINIKLDYKTADEWYNILSFAFETYTKATIK